VIYTLSMFFKRGLLGRAITVGVQQQEIIREQRDTIERQNLYIQQVQLEHTRSVRDIVEHFLIAHEQGIDVRDDLLDGLRDLNDHVARLEEHAH
jgi:hypothetical protein